LLALAACPAYAAGNVYAVLPTQGVGATAEAGLTAQVMRLALQEQSLALVPAAATDAAVSAHAVACGQSTVACGRLIGAAVSATHVIVSELWDQAGVLELKVALVDVRVDLAPVWHTHRAHSADGLSATAKAAALALVAPDALKGALSIKGPPGIDIVVDGVVVDKTPLIAPVRAAAGQREIELRLAKKTPLRTMVTIETARTASLVVCARGDALVTDGCGDGDGGGPPVLTIAGAGVAGLGVVGGVIAGVLGALAQSTYDAIASPDDVGKVDEARALRGAALGAGVVGAALVVGGGAALGAGLMLE
jgi:hypothetical protein